MHLTLNDFSTYFFVPLLLLGIWCLFEGGNLGVQKKLTEEYQASTFFSEMGWQVVCISTKFRGCSEHPTFTIAGAWPVHDDDVDEW